MWGYMVIQVFLVLALIDCLNYIKTCKCSHALISTLSHSKTGLNHVVGLLSKADHKLGSSQFSKVD